MKKIVMMCIIFLIACNPVVHLAAVNYSITNATIINGELTIEGTANPYDILAIFVESPQNDSVSIGGMKLVGMSAVNSVPRNGIFSDKINIPKTDGVFSVTITSANNDLKLQKTIYYASDSTKNMIVDMLNAPSSSAEDIATIFSDTNKVVLSALGIMLDKYKALGVEARNEVCQKIAGMPDLYFTLDNIYKELNFFILIQSFNEGTTAEKMELVDEFGEIMDVQLTENYSNLANKIKVYEILANKKFTDGKTLSNEIAKNSIVVIVNSTFDKNHMGEILSKNNEILKLNLSNAVYIADKNKVHSMLMGKNFTNVEQIREAYSTATKEELGGNNRLGGSGVGTYAAALPKKQDITMPQIRPEVKIEGTFTDMNEYPWAIESVNFLSKQGIVNGRTVTTFEPGAYVLREEFVKMLVTAFGMVDNGAKCSFNDLSKEQWYYKYIASAVQSGILKGYGNSTIGIGENVQRYEAFVMISRLIKYKKISLKAEIEKNNFADQDNIPQYARSDVKLLHNSGIISGTNNNELLPMQVLIRAEAAKLLYNIIVNVGGDAREN